MAKLEQNLVFMDTGIFIGCLIGKFKDVDIKILEKIIDQLDNNNIILILPESLKEEFFKVFDNIFDQAKEYNAKCFSQIKEQPKNEKSQLTKITNKALEQGEKYAKDEIKKIKESSFKVFNKIFNHKNTKIIKLSDSILIKALKRSALFIPPKTRKAVKKAHPTDNDCTNYESLIDYLSKGSFKKNKLIFCAIDSDYFSEEKENQLHKTINDELIKYCKEILVYTNPLEMLNKEFQEKIPKEEVKQFGVTLADLVERGRVISDKWPFQVSPTNLGIKTLDANVAWVSENSLVHGNQLYSSGILNKPLMSFCPYCGSNVTKELRHDPLEIYGSAFMPGSITCPNCHRNISLN